MTLAHVSLLYQMPTEKSYRRQPHTALQTYFWQNISCQSRDQCCFMQFQFPIILGMWRPHCSLVQETWIIWRVKLVAKKNQWQYSPKSSNQESCELEHGVLWVDDNLWTLAAPALRIEQLLETGFQSQRTGTANILLWGKTVEPLPIAEGTWSLELTLLPRKGGRESKD